MSTQFSLILMLLWLVGCGKPATNQPATATTEPKAQYTDLGLQIRRSDGTIASMTCDAEPSVQNPKKYTKCKGNMTIDEVVTVVMAQENENQKTYTRLRKENDELREALRQLLIETQMRETSYEKRPRPNVWTPHPIRASVPPNFSFADPQSAPISHSCGAFHPTRFSR